MESPVAAARPPLDWKEPAAPSPLHKHQQQLPSCSLSLSNQNNNGSSSTATSSNGGCNNNNTGSGNGNGGLPGASAVKTIPRSDANPYPTTFVQADTTSFKQVVQMLTGSSETAAKHAAAAASSPRPAVAGGAPADLASPRPHVPPHQQQQHHHHHQQPPPPLPAAIPKSSAIPTGPKRPAFKLYERRHNSFKNLRINPLVPGLFNGVVVSGGSAASSTPNSPTVSRTPTTAGFSPRYKPEILSPSILDFPSLALSPVTPLSPDPFNRPPATASASSTPHSSASCSSSSSSAAEDRAIAEKGFYLHPSPRSCLGGEPPRLLPLFPVTSPRVGAAAASAAGDSSA